MNDRPHLGATSRDPREVLTRQARPPDLVLRYGDHADHVADVHLPPPGSAKAAGTDARALLILFMHGGFWRAEYGRGHTAPLAEALARSGAVVCAPEYRRSGQPGGWPVTFDDVAAAVDRRPGLVANAAGGLADVHKTVLAGHSALWAASRHRLPVDSRWFRAGRPGRGAGGGAGGGVGGRADAVAGIAAVVALAAVSDLASCHRQALGQQAAGALMGGGPDSVPGRYRQADPARLLPVDVPVRLVHGTGDDRVPAEMSLGYWRRARLAGDDASCLLLPGAGHFEVIDPFSGWWPRVEEAFWV